MRSNAKTERRLTPIGCFLTGVLAKVPPKKRKELVEAYERGRRKQQRINREMRDD